MKKLAELKNYLIRFYRDKVLNENENCLKIGKMNGSELLQTTRELTKNWCFLDQREIEFDVLNATNKEAKKILKMTFGRKVSLR